MGLSQPVKHEKHEVDFDEPAKTFDYMREANYAPCESAGTKRKREGQVSHTPFAEGAN